MRTLFLFSIILAFIACSSNQNKFIELDDDFCLSEDIDYKESVCFLLIHYDSLYAAYDKYKDKIVLTREYENIEELITNLDQNLIDYFDADIEFPVIKYKNRFFVYLSYDDYNSAELVVSLIEPQKVTATLVRAVSNQPVF